MKSEYVPEKVKVLKFEQETEDIYNLTVNFRCNHDPGQFLMVGLPGTGEAPISISSFSDRHCEMHIRKVGTVTNALEKLRTGDLVFVRGPYGKGFPMEMMRRKGMIFIGGGCGVAPLKSVIEFVEKNRDDYGKVSMFFGFRDPGEILFQRRLAEWKRHFEVFLTVDRKPARSCYSGRVGFVTQALESSGIDPVNRVALICGPTVMMKIAVDILRKKGFGENQIYLSTERLMDCGLGICGHCMIHGKYTCLDGPVFRYDELGTYGDD
jgi:sulfite reductase subunit B